MTFVLVPRIPELIHQTAKTAELDEECRGYQERVKELHPTWQYRLWTDADNSRFVRREFPDFVDVFGSLPRNIMRADVIRYLLMYRLGGLYLDTDYELVKPFDLTDHACVLPLESEHETGPGTRLMNAFFAAAPRHPFFRLVIEELRSNPPLDPAIDVLEATGPVFLTRMLESVDRGRLEIFTPERALFSPRTPRTQREYRAILADGRAYGMHHCHGTWRDFTPRQRTKQRLAMLVRRYM